MREILIVVVAATTAPAHDLITPASVLSALAWTILACIPIGLSLWALLDAVHRPRWAWALSPHRQVAWLVAILFGVLAVPVGLGVSLWYLLKVRPTVAAVERGELGPG